MEVGKDNYSLLMQRLDGFIRKYYTNQIIRGSIWFGVYALSIFLILNLLEYQFYFSSEVRTTIFYAFAASSLGLLYYLILQYVLKYFHLGKIISHKTAANIIGLHFGEVKDKLYNILQLKEAKHDFGSIELINASINQKIKDLHPVPFLKAIDISKNKKHLKYLIPPALVLVFIIIAAPNIIKESTKHYVQYDTHFERKAPFDFIVKNADQLSTIQFADYPLSMSTKGSFEPKEVNINIDGYV